MRRADGHGTTGEMGNSFELNDEGKVGPGSTDKSRGRG
jgi:hypothetical protein